MDQEVGGFQGSEAHKLRSYLDPTHLKGPGLMKSLVYINRYPILPRFKCWQSPQVFREAPKMSVIIGSVFSKTPKQARAQSEILKMGSKPKKLEPVPALVAPRLAEQTS